MVVIVVGGGGGGGGGVAEACFATDQSHIPECPLSTPRT